MKNTLTSDELYQHCDLSQLVFETTDNLTPLDIPLGQQRALEAIEFGIDIEHKGYNLFVLGGGQVWGNTNWFNKLLRTELLLKNLILTGVTSTISTMRKSQKCCNYPLAWGKSFARIWKPLQKTC